MTNVMTKVGTIVKPSCADPFLQGHWAEMERHWAKGEMEKKTT